MATLLMIFFAQFGRDFSTKIDDVIFTILDQSATHSSQQEEASQADAVYFSVWHISCPYRISETARNTLLSFQIAYWTLWTIKAQSNVFNEVKCVPSIKSFSN